MNTNIEHDIKTERELWFFVWQKKTHTQFSLIKKISIDIKYHLHKVFYFLSLCYSLWSVIFITLVILSMCFLQQSFSFEWYITQHNWHNSPFAHLVGWNWVKRMRINSLFTIFFSLSLLVVIINMANWISSFFNFIFLLFFFRR